MTTFKTKENYRRKKSSKVQTSVYIDPELLKRAKKEKIVLTRVFEDALKEVLEESE